MLPLIALRNLRRNRRRTALALLVVAAGVTGLLLTAGFIRYSFGGLSTAIVEGGLAHLELIPAADLGGSPAATDRLGQPPGLTDWAAVKQQAEAMPEVRAAGGVMQLSGMLTHVERSAPFVGIALEPERMRAMGIVPRLRAGRALPDAADTGHDTAIVGQGLARALQVSAGDVVTAMVATADGGLDAVDLDVTGIFTTGLQELDARVIQVHLSTAQRLLGTANATSVLVGLRDPATLDAVQTALKGALAAHDPPMAVLGWEERAPFYGQVRGLYLGIFVFLGSIVALLVTLSTANTLLMAMLERTREFAVLLAIGTTRVQLALLILCEALWVAVLGSLVGCVAGGGIAAAINALHVKMPPPPAAADPVDLALVTVGSDFVWAALFMGVVLVVAAIPPVLRIWRLRVVDGLAFV
ncbi:MAG: FtsX-like permease family protein [Vicinamibacterales bacterium]